MSVSSQTSKDAPATVLAYNYVERAIKHAQIILNNCVWWPLIVDMKHARRSHIKMSLIELFKLIYN